MFTDARKSLTRRIASCIRSLLKKGKSEGEIRRYVKKCYGKRAIMGK